MGGLSRRGFLTGAATVAAGALAARPDRAVAAPGAFDGTIRVLGLGYDLDVPGIREQAQRDLGFEIVSISKFPTDIKRLVDQEPASFDLFSCFQQDTAEFWATGNLQPVEIAKIQRWQSVTPLYKLGKAKPGTHSPYGQGDAAFRRLYVDPERSGRWRSAQGVAGSLGRLLVQWVDERSGKPVGPEPRFCSGVPSCFNFDSFAYNVSVFRRQPEALSWAELLNARWRGRIGLNSVPEVGLQDLGNAVRAARLMKFGDLGNPTRKEIDRLVKILLAYRARGQFFDVWANPLHPVAWMANRDVVACTMYAAQIGSLAAIGAPIRQADPPEGYRAFAGLISISNEVRDPAKLAACYDFLNWWHSGFTGATLLRWGYYSAVQATARKHMEPGEYAYWIDGKPAERTYKGPYGDTSVAKDRVRDGGSFRSRASRISSWNSTPRQEDYLLERWQQFVSSF